MGFLAFPLPLPWMGLGQAIAAREKIRQLLMPIAQSAKEYVGEAKDYESRRARIGKGTK